MSDLFEHIHEPEAKPDPHHAHMLRDYQHAIVKSVIESCTWHRSVLFTSATGTGKTVCFVKIIDEFLRLNPTKKALVLAHRRELISQAADRIYRDTGIMPEVEMASDWAMGFGRVVVSSVQTQVSGMAGEGRMTRFDPKDFAVVVFDEAHRAVSHSWMRVQKYYLDGNPDLKCVLCTATPDRSDGKGLAQVADHCAFVYPLKQAVHDGWLCSPMWKVLEVADLDYSAVHVVAGELNQKEVGEILERDAIVMRMAKPIVRECIGKQTLVFAGSVKQSKHLADIINVDQPDSAVVVHGNTPDEERKRAFEDFAARRKQFLINVGIVTEGTDLPGVEVVALCRPTKSRGLYEQMIGRGVRTVIAHELSRMATPDERKKAIAASDKPHFTVIEFEGNAGRHALVTLPDVLAGDMTPPQKAKLKAKAKAALELGESTDVERALEQMRADEAKEEQARKRAAIKAAVKYQVKGHNPWELYGVTPPKADDRYRYTPKRVPMKIVNALAERGVDCADMRDVDVWKAWRKLGDRPTLEQVKHLAVLGHDPAESVKYSKDRVNEILGEYWEYIS